MTEKSRARFAEVVRADRVDLGLACALLAVEADPDTDPRQALTDLDRLAAGVRSFPRSSADPEQAAESLHQALGVRGGFAGSGSDYTDLRSSLLPEVLRRRRGLPILLSVVWLEVARRLGVPAYGVGLPGHFVVAVGVPGAEDSVLVDPFAGGVRLSREEAMRRVRETSGLALQPGDVDPWSAAEIVLRVLSNVRALAASTGDVQTHLWALDLSLLLPQHPVALRRERGGMLARRGDYLGGAADLEAFAEAVAPVDPESADHALRDARMARARLN